MINQCIKLLKAFNASSHPGEIAHAVCCGMLLGFVPKNTILWYLLFVLFLFLRINKAAFLLSIPAFSFLTLFLDPVFDAAGFAVLTVPFFAPALTAFLDIPFAAFTRIHNSVVLGSLLCSFVLYTPLYFLCRFIIARWRLRIAPVLAENPLIKWILKLPLFNTLYRVYKKADEFRG